METSKGMITSDNISFDEKKCFYNFFFMQKKAEKMNFLF